jgi:hypothetical protein
LAAGFTAGLGAGFRTIGLAANLEAGFGVGLALGLTMGFALGLATALGAGFVGFLAVETAFFAGATGFGSGFFGAGLAAAGFFAATGFGGTTGFFDFGALTGAFAGAFLAEADFCGEGLDAFFGGTADFFTGFGGTTGFLEKEGAGAFFAVFFAAGAVLVGLEVVFFVAMGTSLSMPSGHRIVGGD